MSHMDTPDEPQTVTNRTIESWRKIAFNPFGPERLIVERAALMKLFEAFEGKTSE